DDVELRREIRYALDMLDAPEPTYQPEPFDILAEYPERDVPAVEVLSEAERIELLSSPDADARAVAAHSFFNIELDPKERAALLALAKSDPDAKVRGRAWASLADATEEGAIRDAMLAVLNDSSREAAERGGAAVGLHGVADREDARRGIEALYEIGGAARAKALEAMWRSLWKPYARFFPPHLDDPDKEIARQALRGAGYFMLTRYIDKIASYFDRDDDMADLRDDALFAYALAMPGETTRGRIRGMLRKVDALAELSESEVDLVKYALDERLQIHGFDPVFATEGERDVPETAELRPDAPAAPKAVGRNDPCPCGSGKKYKKCHGA
ncbi:MAG: SEC-C metal-binding domain-containing protein, partial [Bryobacteraceae bacterium]